MGNPLERLLQGIDFELCRRKLEAALLKKIQIKKDGPSHVILYCFLKAGSYNVAMDEVANKWHSTS